MVMPWVHTDTSCKQSFLKVLLEHGEISKCWLVVKTWLLITVTYNPSSWEIKAEKKKLGINPWLPQHRCYNIAHWYRRGHGFKSCSGLNFFSALILQQLKLYITVMSNDDLYIFLCSSNTWSYKYPLACWLFVFIWTWNRAFRKPWCRNIYVISLTEFSSDTNPNWQVFVAFLNFPPVLCS